MTSKLATAGWAYAIYRTMSQLGGYNESYVLGFGSELFLPFLAGTFARVGTAVGERGGGVKHLLQIPALAYLFLYEMEGNTIAIDDAIQYFGGDPEWWIEKPSNPDLVPYMVSAYVAGYYASTAGQKTWNAFRTHLEKRDGGA